MINRDFRRDSRQGVVYLQEIFPSEPSKPVHAALNWGVGVALSALNAAAACDPKALPAAQQYAKSIEAYCLVANGIGGYDASIHPQKPDRYYDDNEWLAIDFVDLYTLSKDPFNLQQAKKAMDFSLSGEDATLGGGIYWHEQKKDGKNTCSNAPAAVASLLLAQATGDKTALDTGKRLYEWTLKLQDADGLFFDSIRLKDNAVNQMKWTYNTALPIRAACLLYDQTKDRSYLAAAQKMAAASLAHWVKPDGRMTDGAQFAHLMCDALIELSARDGNRQWALAAEHAVAWEWDHGRDARGYFAHDWGKGPTEKGSAKVELIHQASMARACWRLAAFKETGK